jgi:hypothetical protein
VLLKAHEECWWKRCLGPVPRDCRDLVETTPVHSNCFSIDHLSMHRTLLDAAKAAGATVRRGTAVVGSYRGMRPS